jgi:hypothetical protein
MKMTNGDIETGDGQRPLDLSGQDAIGMIQRSVDWMVGFPRTAG